MTDLLHLWQSISTYGFGFALFIAVVGSQRGWFLWKREADAMKERIAKLEDDIKALQTRYDYVVKEKDTITEIARSQERTVRRGVRTAKALAEAVA